MLSLTKTVAAKLPLIMRMSYSLRAPALRLLYEGLFTTILAYAAPVWAHKMSNGAARKRVTAAQRFFSVGMTRACRIVSNEALQVLGSCLPADLLVVRAALVYHSLRGRQEQVAG